MSSPLLLRAFVNERLTAAAEEIFQVFERTMVKYEEEASSWKRETERLRGLLQEKQQGTDLCPQSPVCKEEIPPEPPHCELQFSVSVQQEDAAPRHIKEEAPEHWATQRQDEEDEDEGEQLKIVNVFCATQSSIYERDDAKRSLSNCDHEDEFEESEDAKILLPLNSAPSPQTQYADGGGGGREGDGLAERLQLLHAAPGDPAASPHDSRCFLCGKSFSSTQHLTNHAVRMHSLDSGLLCAVCGKTLESLESRNAHLQSHKSSKCCYMCGRHCNSTTALTEHMASHAGVKLHRCHVCGKECTRKGDLKIHMRIHTGEKPFRCSYCCKSFTHSGHLRKHMRSHTGERPHRCDVCGRGFLQSAHLKYHLRTHVQKY